MVGATVRAAVARPDSPDQVAQVLAVCDDAHVPVTAAGGRSGVCGASVPVHGGVVLDLCELRGIVDVDDASLVVDVRPGTFGDRFEDELQASFGLTVGHWPQSMALSTVGGWLATAARFPRKPSSPPTRPPPPTNTWSVGRHSSS